MTSASVRGTPGTYRTIKYGTNSIEILLAKYLDKNFFNTFFNYYYVQKLRLLFTFLLVLFLCFVLALINFC